MPRRRERRAPSSHYDEAAAEWTCAVRDGSLLGRAAQHDELWGEGCVRQRTRRSDDESCDEAFLAGASEDLQARHLLTARARFTTGDASLPGFVARPLARR